MTVVTVVVLALVLTLEAWAQTVTTSITSSGLSTSVTSGATETTITGGTRAGSNLFHSLGEFSVAQGHTATFNNETATATQNIISRVTGGNVSNIFGTVRTTNFGSAALWLINPAGIVFGPSAVLNVGGSVHFSTADYLRFGTGSEFFYADLAKSSTLSTASVTAFGFLGSTPPRAIDVRGGALSLGVSNASLSLVGGNTSFSDTSSGTTSAGVTVTGGSLNTTTGGNINVVSVGAPSAPTAMSGGEVPISAVGVTGTPTGFSSLGAVSLQNATLFADAFGSAGAVYIRGGALTLHASDVRARDQVTIAGSRAGASTMSMTGGEVAARAVTVEDMGTVTIDGTTAATRIQAFTQATFHDVESLTLVDGRSFDPSQTTASRATIDSIGDATFSNIGTLAVDHGAITGVNLQFANIDTLTVTGTSRAGQLLGSGGLEGQVTPVVNGSISSSSLFCCGGTPGNITFSDIGTLTVQGGLIATTTETTANAGSITFQGIRQVNVNGVVTSNTGNPDTLSCTTCSEGSGNAGTVSFTDVGQLTVGSSGQISSRTKGGSGDAGTLSFTDIGGMTVQGLISASSTSLRSEAAAGNIQFSGVGLLTLDGGQINSRTLGNGPAGTITLTNVNNLVVQNGGVIRTNTTAPGDAGSVSITTTGAGIEAFSPSSTHARAEFQRTLSGGTLNSVTLTSGGRIESKSALSPGTTDSDTPVGGGYNAFRTDPAQLGDAGTITINTGPFSMSGNSAVETSTQGAGGGGGVTVTSSRMTLSSGAAISTSSTGSGTDSPNAANYTPGDAGNIALMSSTDILMTDSQVRTTAAQASGGNIQLIAPDMVRLNNASITSSVNGPMGSNGGNIFIDPLFVILSNGSQILAQAVGGNGGNINIVAGTFLAELGTTIDASSQLGISGNVLIQSPIQGLAGAIAPLPQTFVNNANLYGQRCAAQKAGQFSSFIEGTRDALPPQPGDYLSSPLALQPSGLSLRGDSPVSFLAVAQLGFELGLSTTVSLFLPPSSGCQS